MAKEKLSLGEVLQKYSAEREQVLYPTGLRVIDEMLGGGICLGAQYAMWGPNGSGKSTISLQIMKSFLKRGDRCLMIDAETAFNKNQQEAFGLRKYVEDGTLIHTTAKTYVEADEITSAVAKDDDLQIKLVLVDSETVLQPKLGDDCRVDDNQPGQKARQASVWLSKTKQIFYDKNITMVFISHARANIQMTANPYAPASKQAGGFAQKHSPDCIIQVQPGQKFGDKESPEGQVIHITTDKNKFAKPFQKVDAKLFFGVGIKKSVDLIDCAIEKGVIKQSGSFFSVNGTNIRGTDALYGMSKEDLQWVKEQLDKV